MRMMSAVLALGLALGLAGCAAAPARMPVLVDGKPVLVGGKPLMQELPAQAAAAQSQAQAVAAVTELARGGHLSTTIGSELREVPVTTSSGQRATAMVPVPTVRLPAPELLGLLKRGVDFSWVEREPGAADVAMRIADGFWGAAPSLIKGALGWRAIEAVQAVGTEAFRAAGDRTTVDAVASGAQSGVAITPGQGSTGTATTSDSHDTLAGE